MSDVSLGLSIIILMTSVNCVTVNCKQLLYFTQALLSLKRLVTAAN